MTRLHVDSARDTKTFGDALLTMKVTKERIVLEFRPPTDDLMKYKRIMLLLTLYFEGVWHLPGRASVITEARLSQHECRYHFVLQSSTLQSTLFVNERLKSPRRPNASRVFFSMNFKLSKMPYQNSLFIVNNISMLFIVFLLF